jgi:hypothetical protein
MNLEVPKREYALDAWDWTFEPRIVCEVQYELQS